jgi:hypothetical protein
MHIERQAKKITQAATTLLLRWQSLNAAIAVNLSDVPDSILHAQAEVGESLTALQLAISGGDTHD